VKKALHVKGDVTWADCSRTIRYKQTDGMKSMVPIYQELITGNAGLNILVYSGDDDGVCATIGTQGWIWDLAKNNNYNSTGREWQAYKVAGQTAGYLTRWVDAKLAFATVHGAGHEVTLFVV
jgi:hypothetical protein